MDVALNQHGCSYTTIDAQIVYTPRRGSWAITGFARNLTDKTVVSFTLANPSGNNALEGAYLRSPRTFGVRAEHLF